MGFLPQGNLTLTSVVFEYITASLDTFCKSHLTLTSVVFEYKPYNKLYDLF